MNARRWRILVVGVGSIGERHVRCFLQTGRAEVHACDTNADLLGQIAGRYDLAGVSGDFASAVSQPLDAVVIATPAHLHVRMARHAVQQDRHVLIEKPLSVDEEGINELAVEIGQRRRIAAVAYVMRAHPVLAEMRKEVISGRFGEPVQLYATSGQHFPTYRPAYRDIYYRDRATGGGAIQDALTHVVNAGEWLVGPVSRIVADAGHQVLPGVNVEDTTHVLARHGSVMASYSLNQHQAPNESTITVVCRKGTVRFEHHRARWRWMSEPDTPWQDSGLETLERDTIFIRQADLFLDALEGKSAPLCTLPEAHSTLRAILAALRSSNGDTSWIELKGV